MKSEFGKCENEVINLRAQRAKKLTLDYLT